MQTIDLSRTYFRQINVGNDNGYSLTERRSVVVQQVIQQVLDSGATSRQARYDLWSDTLNTQLRQVMRGHQYRIERITQIVPNDRQQQISGSFNLLGEEGYRFHEGLINRLVETSRVLGDKVGIRAP